MRILHVASNYGQAGGAERFCGSLCQSLEETGLRSFIVSGQSDGAVNTDLPRPIATLPVEKNLWLRKLGLDYINFATQKKFTRLLERYTPDIVHFHNFYGLPSYLIRLAQAACPVTVTLHDAWLAFTDSSPWNPKFGLANSYLKVPHGYAHRVANRAIMGNASLISPSDWLADFFHEAGFRKPEVIPNGIPNHGAISRYGRTMIWIGRIDSFKGLPSTIETIATLASNHGWRVIIIGDGPRRQELEKRYCNVAFVGTQQPEPFLEEASILLTTSQGWDNFPTVILEGFRQGLCVIASNLGGSREIIDHAQTGFLYSSLADLSDTLEGLLLNDAIIPEIGAAARRIFLRDFIFDQCRDRYIAHYQKLLQIKN